jgi:SAM-dependent methyltransferase
MTHGSSDAAHGATKTRDTDAASVARAVTGRSNWFETVLGQLVLEREAEVLAQCARRFHGDTMLWLGAAASPRCDLARCMVRSRIFGLPANCDLTHTRDQSERGSYVGDVGALPFRTAYMDAVVVHHGLDHARDPRAAIREIARVVRPGGWLVICGFNPFSSFGVRNILSRLGRGSFGKLRFVSAWRLVDWLTVLDFEVDDSVSYLIYRLPFDANRRGHSRWRRLGRMFERWRMPVGAVYVVMARKRAVRLSGSADAERPRVPFNLVPMPNPAPSSRARTRSRPSS